MKMKKLYLAIAVLFLFFGCSKKEELGVNPYDGGKEPFGISFSSKKPDPDEGKPGETIQFQVKGLKAHEGNFTFSFNEMPAEIVAVTDSTLDVKVPDFVSSGGVSIRLKDQVFFGPHFNVMSDVRVDTDFDLGNGFDFHIGIIHPASNGFLIGGSFTNFNDEATEDKYINSIHFINSLGQSGSDFSFGKGGAGIISSIDVAPNGKMYVSGMLSSFNDRRVSSITRLNANGSLDTTIVDVINPTPEKPENALDTVAAFNGGVMFGSIIKVFPTSDNGVIGVGNFDVYESIDYQYSSRESRQPILTQVKNIVKFKEDGGLDSAFNIKNEGANGTISDAVRLSDGRIIMVGSFTRFNGQPANRIVCIKPDGKIDPTFDIGSGGNRNILSIRYNKNLEKIVISGLFTKYKDKDTQGVVVMDKNGVVDDTFQMDDLDGESVYFAQILNSGQVLVSGSFEKYQGVKRSGLLILESNGDALQRYNSLGSFVGQITTAVETTSSLGHPAVLLGGLINIADDKRVGNIVKIELKN